MNKYLLWYNDHSSNNSFWKSTTAFELNTNWSENYDNPCQNTLLIPENFQEIPWKLLGNYRTRKRSPILECRKGERFVFFLIIKIIPHCQPVYLPYYSSRGRPSTTVVQGRHKSL